MKTDRPIGRIFTGRIEVDGPDAILRLPDGRPVLLYPEPSGYMAGERVRYRVDGRIYEDPSEFFGHVIEPSGELYGSYLNCVVVGFGKQGDPVVKPVNRRGNLRGILKIYPDGLQEGNSVQAYISGHNGRNGSPPTAFFGTVLPRNHSEKLIVSI